MKQLKKPSPIVFVLHSDNCISNHIDVVVCILGYCREKLTTIVPFQEAAIKSYQRPASSLESSFTSCKTHIDSLELGFCITHSYGIHLDCGSRIAFQQLMSIIPQQGI